MKIALIGAELEENLGIRYMASILENNNHEIKIVPFNSEKDIKSILEQISSFSPGITGLSMVFTGRAPEFCKLAQILRDYGYKGHIIAGGHFASFNYKNLFQDFPAFDSIALGEGEEILCSLAENINKISHVPGLCYRRPDGSIAINPSKGNPENLDSLPFPKRTEFHEYFKKPIASILSSRGCWRNCAFCSINAWYKRGGGKKFRVRSVENIVSEMKQLYYDFGVRIFNFQDDNFFLPSHDKALARFINLRAGLKKEGIDDIAIAIKARPDSITYDSIKVLDDLGLFRIFLGVENASEIGLNHLNRKCSIKQVLDSLIILNDFDVHVAFNLLMFEPDTVLDDILINLRFMERHVDNPLNFCRAEAYAGTGLERKLKAENRLLGDYFGFDYRIKDPHSEAFHQIANFVFFERNFSDFGLHYFNMQVDFYFQLLRRFYPVCLTQSLRGSVRNFIKQTNLDTFQFLCQIYDFVVASNPKDRNKADAFAREMRVSVDERSKQLLSQGEGIIKMMTDKFEKIDQGEMILKTESDVMDVPLKHGKPIPYYGLNMNKTEQGSYTERSMSGFDILGIQSSPIPYSSFKNLLDQQKKYGCKDIISSSNEA